MNLQQFVVDLVALANGVIIPFLLGIAFLVFVINVVRFFILGSTNEDGREKARATALYGVFAFVLIMVFWGVTNLVYTSLGLDGLPPAVSDYVELNS